MIDSFEIRDATEEDLPVLLQFEQGVIDAERPFDATIRPDHVHYYDLRELLSSDQARVVVAVTGDKIVSSGFAMIKTARPYLDHDTYAYLGFMYTDPGYRGLGLNAKIIDALRAWANAKGQREIRLTVYDRNDPAIRAYEKYGFKKHIIEMRLPG